MVVVVLLELVAELARLVQLVQTGRFVVLGSPVGGRLIRRSFVTRYRSGQNLMFQQTVAG